MNLARCLRGSCLLVLALLCACARQADLLTDISESEANEVASRFAFASAMRRWARCSARRG